MKKFYEEFKKPIIIIGIFFVSLFAYTLIAGPIPFSVNSVTTTKTDFFTADGQGEQSAVPDQATIYLGITTNAQTVATAKDNANKTADKIIKVIKAQGIDEKDIKTTNYSVSPNYGTKPRVITPQAGVNEAGSSPESLIYPIPPINDDNPQIVGYTVSQNLEIKVKPIDKVNNVIDLATANGANLVNGINFTFSDNLQKSLEKKAREQAVKEAKEKAQNLAQVAGIRLGRVINIIEGSSYPRTMPMAAGNLKLETSDTTQTNVTPGENSVIINVTIYYQTY